MKKTKILTDCISDLSTAYMQRSNIEPIRFYLTLDSGRFMDGYEISASNVLEYYIENGTKIISNPPCAEEYADIYRKTLLEYENLIHFTISSGISNGYEQAKAGRDLLGEDANRVYIVDTKSLSSGMAFLIVKAVEMVDAGKEPIEIVEATKAIIPKINVSFITQNADHLAINERVSHKLAKMVRTLRLRPIFYMDNGNLTVPGFKCGFIEGYPKRYIRSRLRHHDKIDTERAFITHAGCTKEQIDSYIEEIKKVVPFKKIHICTASATVASNCGPGTFGVIFMYK